MVVQTEEYFCEGNIACGAMFQTMIIQSYHLTSQLHNTFWQAEAEFSE